MTDIHTILKDPRYREFAAEATARGFQILPDAFPWKLMGWSDRDIGEADLRCEGGDVLGAAWHAWVDDMIAVVRAQEQIVREQWEWFLVRAWLDEPNPAPAAGPGMLF